MFVAGPGASVAVKVQMIGKWGTPMNVALWGLAGLLAAVFLASGLNKLARPKEKLAAAGMGFVEDFGRGTIQGIGVLEIVGAAGLVLPALLGVGARILAPLSATCLAVLMLGAAFTHARRREPQGVAVAGVLLGLTALLAAGRWGLTPFGG
jgi:hypothetical protein